MYIVHVCNILKIIQLLIMCLTRTRLNENFYIILKFVFFFCHSK